MTLHTRQTSTAKPYSTVKERWGTNMIIDKKILDELSAQAKASPRLRMAMDLRNSSEDLSQRMLNALEPGTEVPIHKHTTKDETY